MSKMNDLLFDIVEDIQEGKLSFYQIAHKHGVTYSDVLYASEEMMHLYNDMTINQGDCDGS